MCKGGGWGYLAYPVSGLNPRACTSFGSCSNVRLLRWGVALVRGLLKRSGVSSLAKRNQRVRGVLPGVMDVLASKIVEVVSGVAPGCLVQPVGHIVGVMA